MCPAHNAKPLSTAQLLSSSAGGTPLDKVGHHHGNRKCPSTANTSPCRAGGVCVRVWLQSPSGPELAGRVPRPLLTAPAQVQGNNTLWSPWQHENQRNCSPGKHPGCVGILHPPPPLPSPSCPSPSSLLPLPLLLGQ